jgi:F-type H+-transporting ATPase subunit a
MIGILAEFDPLRPVQSETVFTLSIDQWNVAVSNHMFMITVVTVLLLIWLPLATRRRRLVPTGSQNIVEAVCVYLREQMAMPCLKEHTDRYIGFVWTMFFFVLGLNVLGMVPSEHIIYLLTGKKNHFGGPATANIWITGALSLITFFMIHVNGIRQQGLWHYIVNFAPRVPWVLMPLIYFIEIISAIVKQVALAIRLFANMLAGHVAAATFLGLILLFWNYGTAVASVTTVFSLFFVLFLSLLDLLIAFLQAYIFAFLSTLFIGFAIAPEH